MCIEELAVKYVVREPRARTGFNIHSLDNDLKSWIVKMLFV